MKHRASKAKPRTQPYANDNERGLWQPLPGFPHSEFLDVAGFGRLIRRQEFPGAKDRLHLVRHMDRPGLRLAR